MIHRRHTNEFSVILRLDKRAANDIESIRGPLPPSPYRDDPPHVTLLDRIRAPHNFSDKELSHRLSSQLNSLLSMPVHAKVLKITNLRGGFYRRTSALALELTPQLKTDHFNLVSALEADSFRIGRHSRKTYKPHVTIRLGIPLSKAARHEARRLFPPGREVSFSAWELSRLVSARGKRRFYQIRPKAG